MDKEENKEASVSISNDDTDTNDFEDDDYDDDDGKHTVALGPQVPLKEHLELDKVTWLCLITSCDYVTPSVCRLGHHLCRYYCCFPIHLPFECDLFA